MTKKHTLKPPSPKIAETIPIGSVAVICGMGAIRILFRNLIIACLAGAIGIVAGIAILRMQVEKLDKIFVAIGLTLSIVPMVYATVGFIQK
jgi:hypothetical protein